MLERVDCVRDETVDEGKVGVEGGTVGRLRESEDGSVIEDVKCGDEGAGTLEDSAVAFNAEGVEEIEGNDGGKGIF
jgi:hypothetical protein